MVKHRAEVSRFALPRAAAVTLAALVLVAAVLVSAWAWLGTRGEVVALGREPAAATAPAEDPATGGSTGDPSAAPTTPATVTVHVTGAVTSPGVHRLAVGARVEDAIAAAGGLAEGADESAVNRAQVLVDAQQVYVPVFGEALGAPGAPEAASGAAGAAGTVDLNTASAAQLEDLPGVGPALAGEIIAWREARGPFSSVEDLDAVPGIGPAILEKVRDRVTV